jgi:glutamate/tyrosine decarboxylase-like PLP-dependent enzyme
MARCLRKQDPARSTRGGLIKILEGCDGIELADSITGDAHKLLNVVSPTASCMIGLYCLYRLQPYDCGIFWSRRVDIATDVFKNAGAPYLKPTQVDDDEFIATPLNIGIENSRRFRGLPVYASLMAYGRNGFAEMLLRQIELARDVAERISKLDFLQLAPASLHQQGCDLSSIYMIVMFRAKDDSLNKELVQRINANRKIYVSPTLWDGAPATRIAVSNWQASAERDGPFIEGALREVHEAWASTL